MSDTLFRRVLVYDPSADGGFRGPTDVLVRGNAIHSVGDVPSALIEQPEVVEGSGHHVLLPGLINAHFHSSANHLKGSFPGLPLEVFMLYESPADGDLRPTPREAYVRTMLGAMEMLRTGTTSVQDDAFLMPYPEPDIIDAVMAAYADSGIRATVALDQPDLPESDKLPFLAEASALTPAGYAFDAPAPMPMAGLLEAYDHLFSRWHQSAGGRLRAAVSVSAPQRVSVEYFEALDAISARHRVPIYAHLLETRVQRTLSREQPRFAGRSLVRYASDLGLLSERMNVIHAVWVDDNDLDLIAESGAVVAHNPVSNLRLGSGVMPFRRIRDRGIAVALGVDEAICDDSVNMWGVVKMAGLIHTITGEDSSRWPTAAEILECLWSGGAAAMLRPTELGTIAPGRLADLTLIDLNTAAFTPRNDIAGQLVYCESGGDVVLTMVDGRVVARNHEVISVDEQALLAEARELFAARAPDRAAAAEKAAALRPAYEHIVRRAASTDVGMNRWVQSG
jgi:5-methylthioadenosine/S-adenosylhomocysteine deaminase